MFEFVCDHIVPGCTHKEQAETREELLEKVEVHLREHHDLHRHDPTVATALEAGAIQFIRPV